MNDPLDNPDFKEFFHRQKHSKYRKCLWHTEQCQKPPIRAHSVQNSGVLDRIAEDGHVIMVKPDIVDAEIRLSFEKVGRNLATTFTGLCSEHDTQLFRPIDTASVDPENVHHSFLVAYRSVLKGFHAVLHSGAMVQGIFAKGVELGELPEDGDEMIAATMQLLGAFQFYPLVHVFHAIFRDESWEALQHRVIQIPMPDPVIAATGVFLPVESESAYIPDIPQLLIFNAFPQGDSLYVQFTWRADADSVMELAVAPLLQANGEYQLYLLSKFILKYTETFVLKPSLYGTFSEEQVFAIQRYFAANAAGHRQEWDDSKLYLFGSVAG